MIKILLLLLSSVFAEGTLKELSLEYEAAVSTNRPAYFDSLIHGEKIGELNLNIRNEFQNVYSIIRVESIIAEQQFSNVALDTELGFSWRVFDFYTQHRSEHFLDAQLEQNYPNENSIGVRVHLWKSK